MICWKIRIFAYWTTPTSRSPPPCWTLWFAEKFVSLLIEQHLVSPRTEPRHCCDLLKNSYLCLLNNTRWEIIAIFSIVVICWKIRIFAYWTTPHHDCGRDAAQLWFAEKFVSLLIEQHRDGKRPLHLQVVICWKIRIFAYWTTPHRGDRPFDGELWFAEKFVSLLIEQHLYAPTHYHRDVVICWKIRIFAYWTTPKSYMTNWHKELWFAEKFVSLLIEQHPTEREYRRLLVVICWKIRIFAYWTTPGRAHRGGEGQLWFAEKFVSLLIEQHLKTKVRTQTSSCDLLKNSYLCLLNNTAEPNGKARRAVVICWKIRIFAYWTTPTSPR